MNFLDFPFERYPRTWREMSYDFKLMFLYHGSMMLLFVTGQALSLAAELTIAAALLVAGTLLGIRHRRATPWVWPGVSVSRLLGAAATVLLGGLFLFAATPLFPAYESGESSLVSCRPWHHRLCNAQHTPARRLRRGRLFHAPRSSSVRRVALEESCASGLRHLFPRRLVGWCGFVLLLRHHVPRRFGGAHPSPDGAAVEPWQGRLRDSTAKASG